MKTFQVFQNAPITEALLDIRVKLPEHITINDIESFYKKVKDKFPEKKARKQFKVNIDLSSKAQFSEVQSPSKIDGYLFRSSIEKKVVQSRMDGFTFNKLKPYNNWNSFSSEARQLWNIYYEMFKPLKITRIALRYINRINIPLPFENFKEYILTIPEISSDLPQGLSNFFMQLNIPNTKINAMAVINETMKKITRDNKLPFIFDIDVFQINDYSNNTENIWEEFEKLRVFKNEIFFNSLTQKAKELFI
ncbi:MAG: TIGR04255 family protein [Candidatus Cloacimonetes bacterium]|nr:TIGR04255 family protein [Candidatus Cloacimonadota bacterium]